MKFIIKEKFILQEKSRGPAFIVVSINYGNKLKGNENLSVFPIVDQNKLSV